jgi:hypothetical protein
MKTAQLLMPGGLRFGELVSDLVAASVDPQMTPEDDIYLIHRKSAVDVGGIRSQFAAVSDLVRDYATANRFPVDASFARVRELPRRELSEIANAAEIVAAFKVPERSVNTQWIADRLVDAITSEKRVSLYTGVTITRAEPVDSTAGAWRVIGDPEVDQSFDLVINALWDGRLAIDFAAGINPEPGWSHRYRLSVFARTSEIVTVPSAVVAVGPFGDVKNYNGRDFYLSWYPTGLVAESNELTLSRPDPLTPSEERGFVEEVGLRLSELIPGVERILAASKDVKVRGGFVFAQGQGSLSDPKSTIHRRDRFGVRRIGSYCSIDTGKYSTAPWIALNLTKAICGD